MKKFLLLTTILCLLLCSCNSPASNDGELITPHDSPTPLVTTPEPEETPPVALSVYDTLKNFFKTQNSYSAGAVAVTSSYDLLDVYRYIMSEDSRWYNSLRYKYDGKIGAYNDYVNNTYTPDFFGYDGKGGENYLLAVMVRSPSSSNQFDITASAAGDILNLTISQGQNYDMPTEDGGYFIYLVPMQGVYKGQELSID